jgi:hypothetical protein
LSLAPLERRAMAASADFRDLSWSQSLASLWPIFESAARRSKLIGARNSITSTTARYGSV